MGVGLIVARPMEFPPGLEAIRHFLVWDPLSRGRGPSNVKDDFDRARSTQHDDLAGARLFGRMNAESLFASEEEAKRQKLVRL